MTAKLRARPQKQTRFLLSPQQLQRQRQRQRRSWSESDLLKEIDNELRLAKGFLFANGRCTTLKNIPLPIPRHHLALDLRPVPVPALPCLLSALQVSVYLVCGDERSCEHWLLANWPNLYILLAWVFQFSHFPILSCARFHSSFNNRTRCVLYTFYYAIFIFSWLFFTCSQKVCSTLLSLKLCIRRGERTLRRRLWSFGGKMYLYLYLHLYLPHKFMAHFELPSPSLSPSFLSLARSLSALPWHSHSSALSHSLGRSLRSSVKLF